MSSPLEQFELGVFFFFYICDWQVEASFSNLSFFCGIFIFLFYITTSLSYFQHGEKIIASPVQASFQKIFIFILTLLTENLARRDIAFFSLLLSIFFIILGLNVIGIFPYTFAVTGHLYVTFSIAFCIFLGLNVIGFMIHGMYLLSLFLPQGTPFLISSLLVVIEFISYNFRVISLSVRLFANIMAGHTLLLVIYGFNFFLVQVLSVNFLIVLIPIILLPTILLVLILICLEFGVAIIQAYVFTLLTVMYLADAKYLH